MSKKKSEIIFVIPIILIIAIMAGMLYLQSQFADSSHKFKSEKILGRSKEEIQSQYGLPMRTERIVIKDLNNEDSGIEYEQWIYDASAPIYYDTVFSGIYPSIYILFDNESCAYRVFTGMYQE